MKRILVPAVMLVLASAVPAWAQERRPQESQQAPSPPAAAVHQADAATTGAGESVASRQPRLFSKASIEKAVARAGAPAVPQSKPFFKTPWPYVIGGAIVIILALTLGRSSSPNGIY
jgi:hypothetical protein